MSELFDTSSASPHATEQSALNADLAACGRGANGDFEGGAVAAARDDGVQPDNPVGTQSARLALRHWRTGSPNHTRRGLGSFENTWQPLVVDEDVCMDCGDKARRGALVEVLMHPHSWPRSPPCSWVLVWVASTACIEIGGEGWQ